MKRFIRSAAFGRSFAASSLRLMLCATVICLFFSRSVTAAAPPPPESISARDHALDNGDEIDVRIHFAASQPDGKNGAAPPEYVILRTGEANGFYEEVARVAPTGDEFFEGTVTVQIESVRGEPYWFQVYAVNAEGEKSDVIATDEPVVARRQAFDGSRTWLLVATVLVCGSVVIFVLLARWGMPLKVRQIAGLEAIEEAVGRATEMGRSCLFIPGIQDMNEMQTIAGLTILSRVAERAAEYDCLIETPTARSLVMTAARETVENAYLMAGRPDAYNEDQVYYVTDEQFAYVSYLSGKMVREKPAACFYLGSFYAESLILAETGNAVGAIQVAGTAQPAQLPFFVAACDYTLIGEEFFAASAYLSRDPDQLGSLKGQDVGKMIVVVLILVGVALTTAAQVTSNPLIADAADYLLNTMLRASG